MSASHFLTVGDLARSLDQPLHRVLYAIRSRGIEPAFRVGRVRAFTDAQAEEIRSALAEMDRRLASGEEADGE